VVELELLQLVEGRRPEPDVQVRGELGVLDAARDEEAAGGARVRGEDAGDLPACRDVMDSSVVASLEVERSGAP
jgi:hypothetical protein